MRKAIIIALILSLVILPGCTQTDIADGNYSIDVTLSGGSGRSSIESASVVIKDGSAVATIVWSSPYYDFMIIDGQRYEPIQESGNATFQFPITLDEEMDVSADTVAMSQPHLIDYKLFFDSKTMKGE